jgi:2-keto-3-deoxy-L-rhamnonate aldolase RhmA
MRLSISSTIVVQRIPTIEMSAEFAFDFLLMRCDHPLLASDTLAQLLVLTHVKRAL